MKYSTLNFYLIGIAVVSGDVAHVQNLLDEIIRFMGEHADAELTGVETDI